MLITIPEKTWNPWNPVINRRNPPKTKKYIQKLKEFEKIRIFKLQTS